MDEAGEDELLEIAVAAARVAASELLARFGRAPRGVQSKSTPTDLVSEADVEAERAVRELLADRRPGDEVLGEEGTEGPAPRGDAAAHAGGKPALRWIVDPLDGTVNFLFGIPVFAVSVACEDAAGTVAGVVLDPVREECFTATRSGQALLDGEPIRCSSRDQLASAMVATGFGYDAAVRERQAEVVARVLPRVRDIRRCGAAALDLAWTACGRFDAYYERGLKVWDRAAGELIAGRAGLGVRELAEESGEPPGIVVAPASLIEPLYELVA